MAWYLQQINNQNGNTNGPAAVARPYVSVYLGQQHVGYRDAAGNIWDSFYSSNTWQLQQINGPAGNTKGPAAIVGPFIGVYENQQHFAYIDHQGNILDTWYDSSGHWNQQKINNGGNTGGPAACAGSRGPSILAGLPGSWADSVSIWNDYTHTQQHFVYVGVDLAVYDAFWNGSNNSWTVQKLTLGGNTSGPEALSSAYGCTFDEQQHVGYQGVSGDIWDAWYDGHGHWALQKINNGGQTNGPPGLPGSAPFIWVDPTNTQQHFTYVGSDEAIYDAYWDSNGKAWHMQKLNASGNTNGPVASGGPFASVFNHQQHVGYRDSLGAIWDCWYDGSATWSAQKINDGGNTRGPIAPSNEYDSVFVWVDRTQQHFTYLGGSGSIWDAFYDTSPEPTLTVTPDSIVLSYPVNLGGPDTGNIAGPVNLTITAEGDYNFSGQLNNSNIFPYTTSVLLVIATRDGTAFTFSGAQSIGAGLPTVNNNWNWDNSGNNATIKDVWSVLQSGPMWWYYASATLDLATIWNTITQSIQDIKQVVSIVGSI